ncbi:MAG: type I restriction enzyme HsdR N-terminal domain-containing protein [Bacteroidota bacterium]
MRLLQQAIKDRYVHLDEKNDTITYLPQGKSRKYSNPEEQVQLETYLDLIYHFGYPPEYLRVSERMKIGSETREADIVVYRDKSCKDPLVIVECKKSKISDRVFSDAIDQGFSYAAATNAEFVWATSGDRDAYFKVLNEAIMERDSNRIRRIPSFKEKGKQKRPRKTFRQRLYWWQQHPVISDTMVFGIVLLITTIVLSKVTVEFLPDIYEVIEPYWKRFNWTFNALFNVMAVVAMLVTLGFGRVFMRSHQFYQATATRRRVILLLIAIVLFVPVWFIGTSNSDPQWWTWQHYYNMEYPIIIYLWPYIKAIPFQLLTMYGLIWLLSRK